MAWTAPRTWTTGELVTAAMMNTDVRDNALILKTSITNAGLIHQTGTGAQTMEIESTDNDAILLITSDTDEGQDSEIHFAAGGSVRGRIEYSHHATAATQDMNFFVGDNAVQILTLGGDGQMVLPSGAHLIVPADSNPATPVLGFGAAGATTGLYQRTTATVNIAIAGAATWEAAATYLGTATGSLGAALLTAQASSTVPSLVPIRDDPNTGIGAIPGWGDHLTLICGGNENVRLGGGFCKFYVETASGETNGWRLRGQASTATYATLAPNSHDDGLTSGIGGVAGTLSLITNATEKMHITSAGLVGIGVTPSTNLHIQENNSSEVAAIEIEQLGAGDAAIQFTVPARSWIVGIDNSTSQDRFIIGHSATAGEAVLGPSARLILESGGEVGLGMTPRAKLHLATATEQLAFVDAGSASATEQDWIQVLVGDPGTTGYIRVYSSK